MALQAFGELRSVRSQHRRALQQQIGLEPAIAVVAGLETEVSAAARHKVDQAFRGHELR
jgi:hypothetical protein